MPENVLAALSNNPIAQRKNILHIFQLRFELRQFRWQTVINGSHAPK